MCQASSVCETSNERTSVESNAVFLDAPRVPFEASQGVMPAPFRSPAEPTSTSLLSSCYLLPSPSLKTARAPLLKQQYDDDRNTVDSVTTPSSHTCFSRSDASSGGHDMFYFQEDDDDCKVRFEDTPSMTNIADVGVLRTTPVNTECYASVGVSAHHEVTVVPVAGSPEAPGQLGLSRALQLGSRVSFLPVRKALSLRELPRLLPPTTSSTNSKAGLSRTSVSNCANGAKNVEADVLRDPHSSSFSINGAEKERKLVFEGGVPSITREIPVSTQDDDLSTLTPVVCSGRSASHDILDSVSCRRRHQFLAAVRPDFFSEEEACWNSDIVECNCNGRRSKEKMRQLKAFSVELASLLHRGFSSTVWLCNPNTPISEQVPTHSRSNGKAEEQNKKECLGNDDGKARHFSFSQKSKPAALPGDISGCPPSESLESEGQDVAQNRSSRSVPLPARTEHQTCCLTCRTICADVTPYEEHVRRAMSFLPDCDLRAMDQKNVSIGCTTVRAADNVETPVVMKVVHKAKCSAEELKQLSFEADLLAQLSHPHIVGLLSVVDSETEQWMFFEHAPLGDLHSATIFKVVSEDICRWIIFQLLLALHELHTVHSVIHCDVKPHNVLLFNDTTIYTEYTATADFGFYHPTEHNARTLAVAAESPEQNFAYWRNVRIKLSDFGFAKRRPPGVTKLEFECLRGTHGYFAPELLRNESYTEKIDMWALGVITFSLMGGYEPFYPMSACLQNELEFDTRYWSSVSKEAKDFIRQLLQSDPEKRFNAAQALGHDWITSQFRVPVQQVMH